ncbi:MAG: hypothetical protein IPJ74_24935 [Saprospiraceae bacterium]|nr:hypothetical protein [Saprospiraceae bacterium]
MDVILHKCYRNPRQVLLTAFALGLGIYNENGKVVQRLENNQHWESLGFTVESGNSKVGDEMIISRSKENSPLLFEDLPDGNQIQVQVESFENVMMECNTVVELIIQDLDNELLPQDINVISLDDRHSKRLIYYNFPDVGKKGY